MNKKSLVISSLFITVSLYAAVSVDDKEKKIFLDKFSTKIEAQKTRLPTTESIVSANKVFIDTNVSDIVHSNAKSILNLQKQDHRFNEEAKKEADGINAKEFERKFNNAKQDILYDKKLGWGEQAKLAQRIINENGNDKENNFFFNSKETVYIFISSSMPRETLLNYIESVRYQQDNFVFVLRGMIGEIKKIQPTLLWIKSLIGDKYASTRIIIDPRLSKKFNINQVPAVVYTEKTMFELQAEEVLKTKNELDSDTYIAYGDMPIKYALRQLNEKKNNDFLESIIRKMETR